MIQYSCNAFLFDLDGTLVDSQVCVERHWRRWAKQHDVDVDELLEIIHGRPAEEVIRRIVHT